MSGLDVLMNSFSVLCKKQKVFKLYTVCGLRSQWCDLYFVYLGL